MANLENVQKYAPRNASTSVTQHKAKLHFVTDNYWGHYVGPNLHCKTAEKKFTQNKMSFILSVLTQN